MKEGPRDRGGDPGTEEGPREQEEPPCDFRPTGSWWQTQRGWCQWRPKEKNTAWVLSVPPVPSSLW